MHIKVGPGVLGECAASQLSEQDDRSCCGCLFQSNKQGLEGASALIEPCLICYFSFHCHY